MPWLKFILRLAIGTALLAYLFYEHELNLGEVGRRMLDLPLALLGAALLLDLAGQSLSAFRWSRVLGLGGKPVSFGAAWPVYFSGMFFNICLPTSIGGDVYKAVTLGPRAGGRSVGLASVFMDRNVGLAALLTLGLGASLLAPSSVEATFFGVTYYMPLWPAFLLLIAGYIAANAILFGTSVYDLAERLVLRRLPKALAEKVARLHAALSAYRRPLHRFVPVYGVSLLYQASECGAVWLLAHGLGLPASFALVAAMVTFTAVGGLLPLTVNNIGVREYVFCAVLMGQAAALGMTETAVKPLAMTLALVYFGMVVASGLFGGAVYLLTGSRTSAQDAREGAGLSTAAAAAEK